MSIFVLATMMPNLDMNHTESRMLVAYEDVLQIGKELPQHHSRHQVADGATVALTEIDPWEKPYLLALGKGGVVRVVSSGPNMVCDLGPASSDDIYADMPDPPWQRFWRRVYRERITAIAATGFAWVIAIWFCKTFPRIKPR